MTVWVYSVPMPMFMAAVVWILVGIFGIISPSNVGDIAHLSGIGVGLLLGFLFLNQFKEVREKKKNIWIDENSVRNWENQYLK